MNKKIFKYELFKPFLSTLSVLDRGNNPNSTQISKIKKIFLKI